MGAPFLQVWEDYTGGREHGILAFLTRFSSSLGDFLCRVVF